MQAKFDMAVMIDHFGPHPMTIAILGRMWKFAESLWVVRSKQSWSFLVSTYANYLALIFRRLGGEVRVEVGENRQNSEGDQLRPAAEFASLVILLCISRGCRFQATGNAKKKTQNTTLKTYGKLPLFIFLTLYQHLGSKGAKFCVLWSISTDHLNQAKCGWYEIQ